MAVFSYKRGKRYSNLAIYAVLALGVAGAWYSVRVQQVMQTRSRYAVGYLTGGIYTPKSGKRYSYRFRVKGRKYEATDVRTKNMNTENGARFVVEYDSLDPGVSAGHFAAAVPDSIPDNPPNGWKTPPVPIPKSPEK